MVDEVTVARFSLSSLSIRVLVKALLHLWIAGTLAFFAPFLFRWCSLPNSLGDHLPLDIHFTTCTDELHGVCSFPLAVHRYEPESLFSDGINYEIWLTLVLQDVRKLENAGVFQIVVNFFAEDGKKLSEYAKIIYPRKADGFLMKALKLVFFPLYLLGFFGDAAHYDVPITISHVELGEPSAEVRVQFQSKYVLVENGLMLIRANFGLIRHFLASWPLTSSILISTSAFFIYFTTLIAYLGLQKTLSTMR
ncbi:unnamed protein product, partial [Mesorhabditis belari]|uniref:Seipin n=1 Tax=Mesorhabditis belari TaxID=2138241 RepID=A0AAF3F1Y1_9BILA